MNSFFSQLDFQLSTELDCHLFSASLAELNSSANPQLISLTHQPTTSLHFTSLHSAELHSASLGSVLYNLGQTQQKTPCIVVHVFVSAGTYLLSHCLEMGCITPFCCCVRVCCRCYLATAAVYRVTALQQVYMLQYSILRIAWSSGL
jgi:hypothetical protein